jgi:hypothetical protein
MRAKMVPLTSAAATAAGEMAQDREGAQEVAADYLEIIISVDLMTAAAGSPGFRASRTAELAVMTDTSS